MTEQTSGLDRRALLMTGLGAAATTVVGGQLAFATGAHAEAATPEQAAEIATSARATEAAKAATTSGGPSTSAPLTDFIITCDSWAARQPSSTPVMSAGTTQKIVIHHTAYPNSTDYSVNRAIWLARDIQNLHMDRNGWSDTGQHFTVSRGGFVLEGRHRTLEALRSGTQQVVGAHSPGENTRGIGIESEGTYITETPTRQLLHALTKLCVEICQRYGLHAHNIFGHWDFQATQCPGIAFYRLFPEIRRDVAKALGTRRSEVPERTWPNVFSSSRGAVITVLQYLLRTHGYALTPSTTFDAATVSAVQDFQTKNGIEPVGTGGEVTNATWDLLVTELNSRSTGDAVTGLQSILLPKGYAVTISGTFDNATREAVRQMQRLHCLHATGRVDVDTWCAVVGGIVREEFAHVLRR